MYKTRFSMFDAAVWVSQGIAPQTDIGKTSSINALLNARDAGYIVFTHSNGWNLTTKGKELIQSFKLKPSINPIKDAEKTAKFNLIEVHKGYRYQVVLTDGTIIGEVWKDISGMVKPDQKRPYGCWRNRLNSENPENLNGNASSPEQAAVQLLKRKG